MKTGFLWNATCSKEIWSIFWDPYIRNTDVVGCEYCVSDLGGRDRDAYSAGWVFGFSQGWV